LCSLLGTRGSGHQSQHSKCGQNPALLAPLSKAALNGHCKAK
jgi:hypothetical protein